MNREIQVLIDPIKLKGLGITVADLSQQLFAAQSEKPGGRASIGALEQPIRTMGAVKNANELAEMQLFIQRPGTDQTQVIRLEQVATIKDSTSEKRSAAFFNGNPVVGFEVVRSRGESEVDVGKAVRRTLEELQKKHSHIQITEALSRPNLSFGQGVLAGARNVTGGPSSIEMVGSLLRQGYEGAGLGIGTAIETIFNAFAPGGSQVQAAWRHAYFKKLGN